ncbi:MAG: hypothetical protein H6581_08895 [Bacteroidia bacterium]|nr:hypothetical protein [Bacteroidia bacterium]
MKTILPAFGLFILLLLAGNQSVQAQSLSEGSRVVDSKIAFKGYDIKESVVELNYELPYSGIVEIRLFNDMGEKIWQSQYINSYGENRILLKKSAFHPGDSYSYTLNYKQDIVKGELVVDY